MTDSELLVDYPGEQTESSFQALVERHLPLVYSSALRQLKHAALSEHVSHVTFLLLARQARRLPGGTILPNWLFRTARHVVSKVVRVKESPASRAQEMRDLQEAQGDIWDQAALFIDDALDQLGDNDRGAVLLHYFQNKRLREIAPILGMNEEAAEKCVNRATQKLQKFLAKRCVPIPLSAMPGLIMTHNALAAPSYLAADIAATAANKKVISTAVYSLLKTSTGGTLWLRSRSAMMTAAVIVLLLLSTLHFWPKSAPAVPANTRAVAPSPPPSAAIASEPAALPLSPPPIAQPVAAVAPIPVPIARDPPSIPIVQQLQQPRPPMPTNRSAVTMNAPVTAIVPPTPPSNAPANANPQYQLAGPGFYARPPGTAAVGPQQPANTSAPVIPNVPPAPSKFISNNYTTRWSQPPRQAPRSPKKK